MLDVEQIEGFADDEVDEIVDACGIEIESGVSGGDDAAGEGDGAHVFDVDEAQRGFAMDEDQSSSFLEGDGRRSGEQVRAAARGDRAKGVGRTRDDDHAIGEEAA